MKVVFSGFKANVAKGDPGLAGPQYAEADRVMREHSRVLLNYNHHMKGLEESQETKILFELQAVDGT